MLPLLWDETFPLVCTSIAPGDRGARDTRCGARLAQRDEITLECSDHRCRTEYRVQDGVPVLVSPNSTVPIAEYDDELLAQMYAEMHFTSFETDRDVAPRPMPADGGLDALGRHLLNDPDLTGSFYSTMAEIVLAHSPSNQGLIADVACGMARMAFELDKRRWGGSYVGIDLSPRLLTDAHRAFSGEEITIRMAADPGRVPRSRVVSIQAPKLDAERSLLAVGDAARLPLADRSCTAVIGLNLIDRVDDPAETVKELWRCVMPGGILVLADKRNYSFDPVFAWLDQAAPVELAPEHRSVIFALRKRESREVAIHDDAIAVFRRV
jgi:SAM-dependent methyltransferase/uncharacterized protein YbaR (Trm112 family)